MERTGLLRIASRVAVATVGGELAAPEGQILAHLGTILHAKYAIEMSYRSFADRVRGPWRDAMVEHWQEHAKDERESAYKIAMKMVALGGDPMLASIQVPPCPSNLAGFYKSLAKQEMDAIVACRELIQLAGNNTGLRLLAEETITLDSHHLDDLFRMCESNQG